MGRLRSREEHFGLRSKLMLSIVAAFLVAAAIYFVLITWTNNYIQDYFDDNTRWMELTDAKAEEFQTFVRDNGIRRTDEEEIKAWNKKNGGVYIYIYDDDETFYESSTYIAAYSYENYRRIKFSDGFADLSIFYAIDYRYYMIANVAEIVLAVLLFFFIIMRRISRIVEDIKRLENEIKILEGGGLDHVIESHGNDEIGSLERSLNDMRIALSNNIAREEELTRANNDLVTRMAHDLRTPLTSLLLYLDLLEKHKYTSEEQMDKYIDISRQKAESIKFMSDQLFERFLITGNKSFEEEEPAPVRYVLEDMLSTLVMTLEAQGYNTVSELEWPDFRIVISTSYMQRIIDNVYSNILKYADRSMPVNISLRLASVSGEADDKANGTVNDEANGADSAAVLSISNHIGERKSSEGGSNIGLENISMMLEKMGGTLDVNDDGNVFELVITLPEAKEQK